MSFTSIVKVLPEALRHPAGLAMVGSFAFHGFLFAGGIPFLPTESDAINSQRLVSLIRLSPAEQRRLPQVGASQLAPLPQPPPDLSSFVLPPLAKLPDLLQQPNLPSNLLTPNLPPASLGSVPTLGSAPPISISPGRPLPFISPNQIPAQRGEGFNPLPPSSPDAPAPSSPTLPPPNLDQIMKGLKPGEVDDFQTGSLPSDQQIDPSLKETFENQPSPDQPAPEAPGTTKDVDNINQWLAKARETSGDPGLAPQNINITPDYPKAACQDRPQGFAIVGATVRPTGELAEAPKLQGSSGSKILDDAALETVRNYRFQPTGKYQALLPTLPFKYSEAACAGNADTPSPSPSESPTNLSQSLADDRQKYGSKLKLQPVDIEYGYPEAACKDKLEGQPQVKATAKPDGKLVQRPTVTKSTGHAVLDSAAINAMVGHAFPATGKSEAYVFSPSFDYSEATCSGTGESQSSDQESEKTTPESSQPSSGASKPSTTKNSDSPASSKKSNQPTSKSPSKSSEGAASPSSQDSQEEPTAEESPEATTESTQESPDAETTTTP